MPTSARAPSNLLACNRSKQRAINLIGHRRHPGYSYRFRASLRQFYSQTLRQKPRQRQLADTIVFQAVQHSRRRDFHFRVTSFSATASRGFRIFEARSGSANSIDLPVDFPEDLPRRKWSLLPSRSLYPPMATHSTCPLPIRWQVVDTSRFMFRSPHRSLFRSGAFHAWGNKLSSFAWYLATRKKLYGATTEGAVMRTWVASMDRFDVLVDAGNSPLLPSTATRYRSRRASVSSGLPPWTNKRFIVFRSGASRAISFPLHLLSFALSSLSFSDRALTSLFSPFFSFFLPTYPFALLRFY